MAVAQKQKKPCPRGKRLTKDAAKKKAAKSAGKPRPCVKKRTLSQGPASWNQAVMQARKELGITGMVLLNKGPEGKKLYKRAKQLHEAK